MNPDTDCTDRVQSILAIGAHPENQLWLSTGTASLDRSQLEDSFSGQDRSALVKRTQPLADNLAPFGSAGLSSYDRLGDRITSTNLSVGIQLGVQ